MEPKRILDLLIIDDKTISLSAVKAYIDVIRNHPEETFADSVKEDIRHLLRQGFEIYQSLSDSNAKDVFLCNIKYMSMFKETRYFILKGLAYHIKNTRQMSFSFTFEIVGICLPHMNSDVTLKEWPSTEFIFLNTVEQKRILTQLVVGMVKSNPEHCKHLLSLNSESLLSFINTPQQLSDFYINVLESDHSDRIFALHGMFILIHKYGIEYPKFYSKVYSMIDISLLNSHRRGHFFGLLDIFLQSTHLPNYIVSSFIKRIARLLLFSNVNAILLGLAFIFNLLVRHPACMYLINNVNATNAQSDPFLLDTDDLSETKSTGSSLWEIKTFQRHYYPRVVAWAQRFNSALLNVEEDISELLNVNGTSMILRSELSMVSHSVPIEIEVPDSLF